MIAKKIALGFGIAVVFPMLIHYGVSTFVHPPKWEQFHLRGRYDESASPLDMDAYKMAEKRFQEHLFAFAVPLGLVALMVGAYSRFPAVGAGLMFGGIFSIGDGYFTYWSELADALKFISLILAFLLLLFLGYRRLERNET
jgi:hypothetical protein